MLAGLSQCWTPEDAARFLGEGGRADAEPDRDNDRRGNVLPPAHVPSRAPLALAANLG